MQPLKKLTKTPLVLMDNKSEFSTRKTLLILNGEMLEPL